MYKSDAPQCCYYISIFANIWYLIKLIHSIIIILRIFMFYKQRVLAYFWGRKDSAISASRKCSGECYCAEHMKWAINSLFMPTALSFRPQKSDKTTRPVGHSSTCTSDLYRRRARLSRLCLSAGRAGPGLAALGPAGPDRTSACGRAAPGRPRRAGPRRAVTGARPGFGTRPAARLRRTRQAGFGMRPAAGLRNATRLRRTRQGQVSARRLLNWSPVDGSDFVVVFLDFSNYHPFKVAKCLARRLMVLY